MDSSSLIRVVTNMMSRYGGPATALVVDEGVYDTTTSENVVGPDTEYDVLAMVFDYTLQSNGLQTAQGTLIETGDKQVFVQPLATMPVLRPNKDFFLVGNVKYRIVTYKELNPSQSANVLIELFVRA